MAKQAPETQAPFKDYYQVLHLQPEADAAMLDQAYWHLARLYNAAIPDDATAKESLDDLNEAYSVLRSPALRREYDRVREVVIAGNMLPVTSDPGEPPPPLTIMSRARPKPREDGSERDEPVQPIRFAAPRLELPSLRLPAWQSIVSAVIIVAIAGAALVSGTQPVLVIGLAAIGLAISFIPLVRHMPSWPEFPSSGLNLPTIRAPRMPERPAQPNTDPDALRRQTEAMRARWRQVDLGDSSPLAGPPPGMSTWPEPSLPPRPAEEEQPQE